MYFDTKKEVEKTKKIMKNPKLEIEDTRRGLEKLQQYIKNLKEQGIKDEKIRQKINDEFSQEIHEYFKTTGTEYIKLEEQCLEVLETNPQLVENIYNKVKDEAYKFSPIKEEATRGENIKKLMEFEIKLILKRIQQETISKELKKKIEELSNSNDKKIKEYLAKRPKIQKNMEYYLRDTELEKTEKNIKIRRRQLEEYIATSEKQSMKLAGHFFRKYGFLQEFLEGQNEDYHKLGMSQMEYKMKTDQDEKDIGLENIFTDEYIDTLTSGQLSALNAFWQNRYTKAIERIKKAIFIADSLNLWEELKQDDYNPEITDEQISNCIVKMKVLDRIYVMLKENLKDQYIEANNHKVLQFKIEEEIDIKSQLEFKKYFDEILPTSDNDITHNLEGRQSIRDSIKTIYDTKFNMIMRLIHQIEYNSKITNWGYIPENEKDKGKVLLGIDYPGFNMPLRLHINKRELVSFLKNFKNSSVIPIYEGNADMIYKGKMLKSRAFMPLTEERESFIIQKNKNLNVVDLKYNYIRHIGNLLTKKNKKIPKIYIREYIDLETGEKGNKIKGEFVPYKKENEEERKK